MSRTVQGFSRRQRSLAWQPLVWRPLAWIVAISCGWCLADLKASNADEPLAWRFTVGETHHYRMTQTMAMTMQLGPQGNQTSDVEQIIDMSWKVLGVDENRIASITQKIDRMRMKLKVGGGQSFDYDTLSDKPAQGMAAMLAPVMKQLTKTSFDVKMAPSGKVLEVNVPDELIDALKNSPGAAMVGEMMSKEGFKQMVEKGWLVLPEKLEAGTKWDTAIEMKNPMVGTQTIRTTYEYKGPRVGDGKNLEAFAPTIDMSFGAEGAPGGVSIKVTKQGSSGEILFNRDAGRLESSKINMDLTMAVAAAGQNMTQVMKQVVEMKYLSADEVEAEAKQPEQAKQGQEKTEPQADAAK